MRHGPRIPTFGEHGYRDDAANGITKTPFLADSIHDLSQQVLVGDVLCLSAVARALDDLAAEAVDLVGRHGAEALVQCIAGFELLAVDQQGPRPPELIAVFVEVTEQRQAAVLKGRRTVLVLPVEP